MKTECVGANYRALAESEKRGYILVSPLGLSHRRWVRSREHQGRSTERSGCHARIGARSSQITRSTTAELYDGGPTSNGRALAHGCWVQNISTIWAGARADFGRRIASVSRKVRDIPEIVIMATRTTLFPVGSSRMMVEAAKKLGIEIKYIEVPGGSHTDVPGCRI